MKIKIKKVGPPVAGRHTHLGYVKQGDEYLCGLELAEELCRGLEFEPATETDRAAVDRLRAELKSAALEAEEAEKRKADQDNARAEAERGQAGQAAREEAERQESERLAELNAGVDPPAAKKSKKAQ